MPSADPSRTSRKLIWERSNARETEEEPNDHAKGWNSSGRGHRRRARCPITKRYSKERTRTQDRVQVPRASLSRGMLTIHPRSVVADSANE